MRILLANYTRSITGGAEKYLQALIPSLIQRGHSLALLYEYPCASGAQSVDSPEGAIPSWCLQELGCDSVVRSATHWQPDVVYCHGLDDGRLESELLEKFRVILFAHTYYGTCVSGRKCYSWPRLQPCEREFGVECLALYYPRRCGGLNARTAWQLFRAQSGRRSRLKNYHAVLVASRHMYQEYERHGVAGERLELVPLFPTDSTPQPDCPSFRKPGGRILFLGRLVDVKGPAYLLQAIPAASAKLGRPLTLTVGGDGQDRAALEELARKLGLTVDFAGWVDSCKRGELMRQADLLAVPSLWPEPFGLAGVEAACLGLPAVGYAVGGIPDWLISGQTGELAAADPPTVEGLADAMVRALRDSAHYNELRNGAWHMSRQFNLNRHIAQLEPILAGEQSSSVTPERRPAALATEDAAPQARSSLR